jgi:hypothetical protein
LEYSVKAHQHKYGTKKPVPDETDGKRKFAGGSVFAALKAGASEPTAHGDDDVVRTAATTEFDLAFSNWCDFASDIPFLTKYPSELEGKEEAQLDLVDDLLKLDIAPLYVEAESSNTPPMFMLPMLARQRLGENMAASYCERMNSIAKDILDEGHSLLNDAELEGMVILRMNRTFMKHVRGKWRTEIVLYANMKGIGLLQPV